MNPRRRIFLLTFGISAALAATAHRYFRTTWQTATEAEVRAAVDPRLLEVDPVDPEAQARLKRADEIGQRVYVGPLLTGIAPRPEELERFIDRERKNFAALRATLAEGPFQRTPLKPNRPGPVDLTRNRFVLWAMIEAGQHDLRRGRTEEGLSLLILAQDWVARLNESRNSVPSSLTVFRNEALLHSGVREILPLLREKELARLAKAIEDPQGELAATRRTIRSEFQANLLPALSDPIAWARQRAPGENPVGLLAGLTTGKVEDPESGLGNYDALQTARDASRFYSIAWQNAARPRGAHDLSGEIEARRLFSSLPVRHPAPKGKFEKVLRDWQYRWELGSIPNTLGRAILSANPANRAWLLDAATVRTSREALRTLIALHRFRLRTGKHPSFLSELVDAHLLAAEPKDLLGSGALRYDPMKGRIWSVGWDGKDGGGDAKSFGAWTENDIVWKTP